MDRQRERIIDRVQKLLRLSTSNNPHESATAAAQAQRLITEHRLEEAELGDVNAEPDGLEMRELFDIPCVEWTMTLATANAHVNGCIAQRWCSATTAAAELRS